MIVKIQNRGHSFKGIAAYLLNPKRDDPENGERVAWSETGNMFTNDIEKAAKVMAWTDANADTLKQNAGVKATGAKATLGAVYHYSLAWAHDEKPDAQHQRQAALATLEKHGLSDHEFFMVAHDDTTHAHVHIVVNLTNQEDGKRHKLGLNKRAMSDWALEYEQQHGLKCEMRVTNRIEAQQLGHNIKHQEQKQDYAPEVTAAYQQSDNGQAFLAGLNESGLTLAQGRKRLVLVDGHGEIHALARQVDGANTKEIKAKLSDVDLKSLVDADELRREILERLKQERESGESEKGKQQERDFKHEHETGHDNRTTGEIAQDLFDLASDPLQDLRGWMDEDGQGRGRGESRDNLLFAGQGASAAMVGELRQVRGESGSGDTPRRTQGTTSQEKRDSRQGYKGRNARALDQERTEKNAKIQKRIDQKTAESRAKHHIDELQEQHSEAQNKLKDLSGFWARHVFKREQYKEAAQTEWAISKTLERQQERFRADIEAFNSKRPEWARKQELSKHGFDDESRAGDADSQGQKADKQNQALEEAQSSPEAAERLADTVQAKTPKQAAQVAQVRQKAEARRMDKAQAIEEQKTEVKPIEPEFKRAAEEEPTREAEQAHSAEEKAPVHSISLEEAQELERMRQEREELERNQGNGNGYDYD